jgi:hypothetical protein
MVTNRVGRKGGLDSMRLPELVNADGEVAGIPT